MAAPMEDSELADPRALARRGGAVFLLLIASWIVPAPTEVLGVEEWLNFPQQQRAIYLRGAMDAWGLEEQMGKTSTPPFAVPAQTSALLACMRDLNMTDVQALGIVEGYMREHPGVLRELPMMATVWVALVRACRVIGPGEKEGK